MESMSRAPFLLPLSARNGFKYGSQSISDSVLLDGLTDPWDLHHMGVCAEHCAKEFGISREAQDTYAAESYKRAIAAQDRGDFANEIVPVSVTKRGKTTKVDADEEPKNVNFDKITQLRPVFTSTGGTVTAANASTLSDGAAAVLVTSTEFASKHGIKPMAQILGYGEASQKSLLFPTAPSLAIPLALERAGVDKADVDLWEINEAFAVVTLANIKLLNLDPAKVNVNGGAVSLGHPLGASGCRIVVTLLHALIQRNLSIGVAAICNGGGGASAIVVKRL
uniref:acetyl-CoA C-acetyltransferase n=1 Tax=Spongospora subterranea TaxID=70186 RepID=A0A0H5R8K4_9EUKA|eukprot:CRZ10450.1 hypothetical protein [Spongospora subterranea]